MIIATKELRKLSLFFFSLALSGVIGCPALTEDTIKSKAEVDANAYAGRFYHHWQNRAVQCQGVDYNNDGYVSCTIGGETTRADGSTEDHTASIECAAAAFFDYGRGCRAMRAMSPTNGQ